MVKHGAGGRVSNQGARPTQPPSYSAPTGEGEVCTPPPAPLLLPLQNPWVTDSVVRGANAPPCIHA